MKWLFSRITVAFAIAATAAVGACGGGRDSATAGPGGATGAVSSPAATAVRAQGTSPSGPAGSSTNAATSAPLQLLKQSSYVCLYVDDLTTSADHRIVVFNSVPAPMTWDGLNFSASLSDYLPPGQGGANSKGIRLTYSGTIAADGKSIKSLAVTDLYQVSPSPSATHLQFTNIPYGPDPAKMSAWSVYVRGADPGKLLVAGEVDDSPGQTVSFNTSIGQPSFNLVFGTSSQSASCGYHK